jgi:hypothetical protein
VNKIKKENRRRNVGERPRRRGRIRSKNRLIRKLLNHHRNISNRYKTSHKKLIGSL